MPPSPEQASVPHTVPRSSTESPVTMSSNPHPSPRSKPQPPPRPVHVHPEVQQTLHNPTPSVQPVMNPQPMMNQPHVMNPQPAMPPAFSPQQQVALYQVSFAGFSISSTALLAIQSMKSSAWKSSRPFSLVDFVSPIQIMRWYPWEYEFFSQSWIFSCSHPIFLMNSTNVQTS